MTTRGVLYVHSAPAALCPHVEWAISGVLGRRVVLDWTAQPVVPGTWRAEMSSRWDAGTAAALASALRGWERLRYEVTEEPGPGHEGVRYSYTPALGVFSALTGVNGDILVPEDRLRALVGRAGASGDDLAGELAKVVGKPWDDELEPFRHAGEDSPVRWLHQVV